MHLAQKVEPEALITIDLAPMPQLFLKGTAGRHPLGRICGARFLHLNS